MHVYSSLLPAHMRSKVDAEEQFMLEDIQAFHALLRDRQFERVTTHHFRTVEIFFKLKYTLPQSLSVDLCHELVNYAFQIRPTLEVQIKAINSVILLLKKNRKANRDHSNQATIDWKAPLDLWEAKFYSSPLPIHHDSDDKVSQFSLALMKFLAKARPNYIVGTPTLWARLAPDFSRMNEEVCLKAVAQLSLLWPAHHDASGHLAEWIRISGSLNTSSEWDFHWLRLFARVAKYQQRSQTFQIDEWAPHLPFLFWKIQQAFQLPSDLGSTPAQANFPTILSGWHGDKSALYYASKLSAELLEPTLRTHGLLHQLLDLLTPFYHPSSAGNSANAISDFVYYVSAFLSIRLGNDKALGRELIPHTSILEKLVELSFLGVYSKSHTVSSKASFALRNVINLDHTMTSSIVMKIMRGLDPSALSQTHQAPSAISALTICGPALLRGDLSWIEHLPAIMQLTLPGIDPNDDGKTSRTLQLYSTWLLYLPVADDTIRPRAPRSALTTRYIQDLNAQLFSPRTLPDNVDEVLWRLGAALESWVLVLLDRLFALLRNQDKPKTAKGTKSDDTFQIGSHMQMVLNQLFVQLSPPLYKVALQRVVDFLQSTFLLNAGKAVAGLVRAVTGPSPELAIQKILLPAVASVLTSKSLSEQELMWQLRLIDGVIQRTSGTFLHPLQDQLKKILALTTAHSNAKVVKLGCKILRHCLVRLTGTYQPDHSRSLPNEAWQEGMQHTMSQFVGVTCSWGNVGIEWHEPSAVELVFAMDLLQTYVVEGCATLTQLATQTPLPAWRSVLRCLLHAVRGAKNILLDNVLPSNDRMPPMLTQPVEHLKATLASNTAVLDRILSLRPLIAQTMHDVQAYWFAADDPLQNKCLRYVIRILHPVLHPRGTSHAAKNSMYAKWRKLSARDVASAALQRKKPKTVDTIPMWPRRMMQDRVQVLCSDHLNQRSFQWSFAVRKNPQWYAHQGMYQLYAQGLDDLLNLSLHKDSKIRQAAQKALSSVLKRYTSWLRHQLPHLIQLLLESKDKDRITGAIHVLQIGRSVHAIWKNWETMQRLIIALCHASEANVLESPEDQMKTQARVLKLFLQVITHIRDAKELAGIQPLLALEAQMQSHWRHQLMFLACFLPWIRTDVPLPQDLWLLVLRGVRSDAPQVQNLSRLLLSRLLKAHAQSTNPVSALPDALFAPETLKALAKDMVANHKIAARSADGQSTDNSPARWSIGVSELMRLVEQERFPPFVRSFGQKSAENINLHHVALVQRLTTQFFAHKKDVSGLWGPVLQELLADDTDERRASMCTAGEILVGVTQANPAQSEEFFLLHLQSIFPKLSVPYAQDWYDVVLLITRTNESTYMRLTEFIVSELELSFQSDSTTDGLSQVRWLTLAQPLLLISLTSASLPQSILDRVKKVAETAVSHPYESVREQVGSVLYKLSLVQDIAPIPLEFDMDAAVSVESELNCRKSFLNLLANYIHSGDSSQFARLLPLFPVVFDTQSYPEPDIARSARAVVDTLSNKLRIQTTDNYASLLQVLATALTSPSWRTRGAVLRFLTVINFHHGLLGWSKDAIERMIISRFVDEKRDVQEMAQYALRSFVRTLDESQVSKLASSFLEVATTTRAARAKKAKQVKRCRWLLGKDATDEEATKKLKTLLEEDEKPRNDQTIESCFGMGAIVLAYPYSVPEFVPALMEELTFHLHVDGSISYLSEIVKSVLLEFKRTHQDSWHEDKAAFSASQLEAIQELLISPHYYS
ncbi:Aste57867_19373 [Aphanomyces stellatus]|uniref:Aste57867_19373 protein n=1 Tax=Aphanomyces stellatus TaxID=120398 RepID=A0A485LCJ4_9STRA|nr:hypothetical protein As57867_019309 [Aphanomyces stellatus]VFT96087.1 Aste57867_19373 [Aphanomyces stellatus]